MIGLLISMFTSLYVTRTFFSGVLSSMSSDDSIRKWFGASRELKKWNVNFLSLGKPVTIAILGLFS